MVCSGRGCVQSHRGCVNGLYWMVWSGRVCCTVSCGVCSVTQGLCERTVMDGVEWPGVLHCVVWCVFSHTGAV